LTRTQQVIKLFRDRFVQRHDCYPVQYRNNGGGYRVVREKLTDDIILSHLKGQQTIGLYGSVDSTTKWLCIDVDDLNTTAIREIQNHARRLKIPYLTELSGKKGYHLWIFFNKPYPNRIARALATAFAFDHEVFPKQDRISDNGLGNLVKAPLGRHQITGNWAIFLDKDLNTEKDQYRTLSQAKTINPIQILEHELPEIWIKINKKPQPTHETGRIPEKANLPIIKDCVRIAIKTGTTRGQRNITGHIITAELRAAGIPQELATQLVTHHWNPKNMPPLSALELETILSAAFGDKEYTYGCSKDGALRHHLTCIGTKECLYSDILRAIK